MSKSVRWIVLAVLTLLPLVTLVHRNEQGFWTLNREAMAAPDEHSYLLMARALAEGHGVDTVPVAGRQAFYPPGLPALLAGWGMAVSGVTGGRVDGFSIESMHVAVAVMLCAAVPLCYGLVRAMVRRSAQAGVRGSEALPLLITGLFATSWHVLETGLFVFSEPAFMVVTFAWLLVGVKWPRWYTAWPTVLAMAGLALGAHLIRGAGLVCVAATVVYPVVHVLLGRRGDGEARAGWRGAVWASGGLAAFFVAYYVGSHLVLPQPPAADSYTTQLLRGLNDGGRIAWWDMVGRVRHVAHLGFTHLQDWQYLYTPLFRADSPRVTLYATVARLVHLLVAAGLLVRLFAQGRGGRGVSFVDVYVLFYMGLYLLWPFNMTRFWVPILPVTLVYAAEAVAAFGGAGRGWTRRVPAVATVALFGLLGVLNVQEMVYALPYYQRRLNYVSDSIRDTLAMARREGGTERPVVMVMDRTEQLFTFAYYLGYVPEFPREGENTERALERVLTAPGGPERVYLVKYFGLEDAAGAVGNLQRMRPGLVEVRRVRTHWNISVVWEVRRVGGRGDGGEPRMNADEHG